jgi:type II secretory pathway component GspD/PulD (secretin)
MMLTIALAGWLATLAPGQVSRDVDTSALINRQLDQRVKLNLNDTPLPNVFKTIQDQTQVPLWVSEDVWATLPWGRQTPITASIPDLPLRDALRAICGSLGLQFELGDQSLEIRPAAALLRLSRRATLEEVRTLDTLARTPLAINARSVRLDTMLAAIDQKLGRPVIDFRPADVAQPEQALPIAQDATLAEALDVIHRETRLTWYPWADGVIVIAKREANRLRLDRPVNLRYDGVDIQQVLQDLSTQSGLPFQIEPGAIQRVAAEFRIVNLTIDAPLRQALESLQGYTGLGYVLTDEGVYIWNQSATPAQSRGRAIVAVPLPDGSMGLVFEDQLSPAARETVRSEIERAVHRIESATTRPTHHN